MSEKRASTYPQAYAMTVSEMESFLARPLIAKLCTHNKDGSIHIVPIWFRYENGEILMGTQEISQKIQNIKRDNHVTVLVDTTEPRLGGVIMYGAAELEYDDVIPKRVSIFKKYMDAEQAPALAARLANQWKPVVVRIKPERVITFDYSKGFGLGSSPDATSMEIA
jgi:PPOX class probable F420-dependent enzyme